MCVCWDRNPGPYWFPISVGQCGLNLLPCCSNKLMVALFQTSPYWKVSGLIMLQPVFLSLVLQKLKKQFHKVSIYKRMVKRVCLKWTHLEACGLKAFEQTFPVLAISGKHWSNLSLFTFLEYMRSSNKLLFNSLKCLSQLLEGISVSFPQVALQINSSNLANNLSQSHGNH